MLAVAAAVSVAAALAVPVMPPAPGVAAAPCSAAVAATYRHSFGGPRGTMTVTARQPLCRGQRQGFALASYTVSDSGSFIFDRATGTITSTNRSLTLNVDVPPCSAQVAGVLGPVVPTELFGTVPTGVLRDPATWHAGGGAGCSPAGTVTFTSDCDGTFQARLTNRGDITAVFVTGDRLLRVASGRSTTLRGKAGSTMTIRASSFTTYVGGWRRPATGCTSAGTTTEPPPPEGVPPAPPPAPSGLAATSFPALVVPSAPGEAAETTDAGFPTNPAAVPTTAVAAKVDRGMSTGSIIAIGIGLLMIVGGAVALTYLIREIRRPG